MSNLKINNITPASEVKQDRIEYEIRECSVCGYRYRIPKNYGACVRCPQCYTKSCSE